MQHDTESETDGFLSEFFLKLAQRLFRFPLQKTERVDKEVKGWYFHECCLGRGFFAPSG